MRKILLDIQKCIDACRRNKIFYGDELVQVKTFNHVSGMKRYGSMESNPHECKICTALNCQRSVHKMPQRANITSRYINKGIRYIKGIHYIYKGIL